MDQLLGTKFVTFSRQLAKWVSSWHSHLSTFWPIQHNVTVLENIPECAINKVGPINVIFLVRLLTPLFMPFFNNQPNCATFSSKDARA